MTRPLFVVGPWRSFVCTRMAWTAADRERARWVRDASRIDGWRSADFVVLDGYTILQSAAIVEARRRGFVFLSPRSLVAAAAMLASAPGELLQLHRGRAFSPGAWALAAAAHRMGVLSA